MAGPAALAGAAVSGVLFVGGPLDGQMWQVDWESRQVVYAADSAADALLSDLPMPPVVMYNLGRAVVGDRILRVAYLGAPDDAQLAATAAAYAGDLDVVTWGRLVQPVVDHYPFDCWQCRGVQPHVHDPRKPPMGSGQALGRPAWWPCTEAPANAHPVLVPCG